MIGWLLFGACLIAVLAFSQTTDKAGYASAADLVYPLPGNPVSLVQVEERSHNLASGASAVEVINSKVYRDSSGRLRVDSDSRFASHQSASARTSLIDPVTGSRAVLLSDLKIAYRILGPKGGENGFALGLSGMGEGLPSSHKWDTKTENLGKRTFYGIECDGTLITQTADPPW